MRKCEQFWVNDSDLFGGQTQELRAALAAAALAAAALAAAALAAATLAAAALALTTASLSLATTAAARPVLQRVCHHELHEG